MSVPDSTPNNLFGDAAAATLAMIDNANNEPAPAPVESSTSTAPSTPDQVPASTDTQQPAPLSWDSLDFSRPLTPEEQQFVRDHGLRHSDYTRKTQELADQRRQIEQYGDLETVQQAMEFVQNLQDPDFLRQLYGDIGAHLGAQTPAGQPNAPAEQNTSGLDPAIQREIEDLKQWRAEQEHARIEQELTNQMASRLQASEDSIRQTYPSYTQADIDAIYKIVPAYDYDLFAAQEAYEELRAHFTRGIVDPKAGFPQAANSVRSDAIVTQPTEMIDFQKAREATRALFSQ